jgi:imidazolonepropionase-like amidohydrolase
MFRLSMTALVALALTLAVRADTPNVYAIRGARIVTAAGAPIESGTIVIRHGLIEAVGPSVTAPPDADVIDGKGLTVYPGLIDLGNTRAADQPVPHPPANMRTTAELERWKQTQILKPYALAADVVKVDDPELTTLASAGITSVLATPSGDVITGQSALVNVAAPPDDPQIGNVVGNRRRLIVVKTPVALHVTFPNRPRAGANAYPESLMGVIAFVRQAFLDAQHYGLEKAHYQRVKTGVGPDQDPVYDAMLEALDRKLPVAFEANESREILRALKMARELKLDAIITGGRDAGAVAADLKSQNVPVIFSLNYPQRSRLLAPDADESVNALRARADTPKVPAALAKAGVLFAFESAGLTDPKEFVRNAAKAVKAGLAPDAAIRALTLNAATIAGAADRLGSIEKNKIANLVVTDGDLFDEKTKVTRVFVNGRAVALDAPARRTLGRGRHVDVRIVRRLCDTGRDVLHDDGVLIRGVRQVAIGHEVGIRPGPLLDQVDFSGIELTAQRSANLERVLLPLVLLDHNIVEVDPHVELVVEMLTDQHEPELGVRLHPARLRGHEGPFRIDDEQHNAWCSHNDHFSCDVAAGRGATSA